MRYAIALGGNIGKPDITFDQAIEKIDKDIGKLISASSRYLTKPLKHPNASIRQAAYLNAVILIESDKSPLEVLKGLFEVECSLGRVRENEQIPWGPRTIDLDLIAAQDLVHDCEVLTLPHPEMHLRDFVLVPMLEVDASWVHPTLRKNLESLIEELDQHWILEQVGHTEKSACAIN